MKPDRPTTKARTTAPDPAAKVCEVETDESAAEAWQPTAARHLQAGWWLLLLFLSAGLVLEALHGFKVGAYLGVNNETRRLMWTLAHAHGTLLGLINLGFAFSLHWLPAWSESSRRLASSALLASSVLMPAGFFLGGVWIYAGDPGLGIVLVPIGGALLFLAVLLTALATKQISRSDEGT